MKDGFVKVAAASIPVSVGDCGRNAAETVRVIGEAAGLGVRILVLPELGLTGCTCGDLFWQDTLLKGALDALKTVRAATREIPMLVFVGLPLAVQGKLYNCAAALYNGHILGITPKTYPVEAGGRWFAQPLAHELSIALLDESVFFGTGLVFACENLPELVVGCEIGADLFAPNPPSTALALGGATVIVNPAACAAGAGAGEYRRALLAQQSARLHCGYVFASCAASESTTDFVFSGHLLAAESGELLGERSELQAGMLVTELDVARLAGARRRSGLFVRDCAAAHVSRFALPLDETALTRAVEPNPFFPANLPDPARRCEELLDIQAAGLAKRLAHTGAKACVLGLSGGLDSTLALLVCVRAMDALGRARKDIFTATMPCFGTTNRTKDNAGELARLLGVSFQTIPITQAVTQHFKDIGLPEGEHSAAFENAQARERTQVLMDIANRCGGLVVGTGDLSELALGWATYNGDHMSMYAVNASIPKTLVRTLVRRCADVAGGDLAVVLQDVLDTPVSPELLPPEDGNIAQKTEDLVGPYALHDFFLYYMVRCGFAPAKIYRLARRAFAGTYADDTIIMWLKTFFRRFFSQQFKRSCMPDGPATGSVSLSPRAGLHMPSDACATAWLAELDAL